MERFKGCDLCTPYITAQAALAEQTQPSDNDDHVDLSGGHDDQYKGELKPEEEGHIKQQWQEVMGNDFNIIVSITKNCVKHL